MVSLEGKVAVVTGASRGVGRGVAEGLAKAGATVFVTGRSESTYNPPEQRTIQVTAASVSALRGVGIPVAMNHNDDEALRGGPRHGFQHYGKNRQDLFGARAGGRIWFCRS